MTCPECQRIKEARDRITPPPWRSSYQGLLRLYEIIGGDRCQEICRVSFDGNDKNEEDCRFIALAPEAVDHLMGHIAELKEEHEEIDRLKSALHDAEAIGDFPSELRDRLFLKESVEAMQVLVRARDALVRELVEAIQKVLADEESRPGAWGPDVTCVFILKKALARAAEEMK